MGSAKRRATQLGITAEQYQSLRESGQRWCVGCKSWHNNPDFARDRHSSDGLSAQCRVYRRGTRRDPVEPVEKSRARRRIEQRVRRGAMPHPNTLPCTDCGQRWAPGLSRHEYDHHLGYDGPQADNVQPVCQRCHAERGVQRGEYHGIASPLVRTARLSEESVSEIRTRYAAGGVLYRQLADEFGVTRSTIGYVVRHRTWRSV